MLVIGLTNEKYANRNLFLVGKKYERDKKEMGQLLKIHLLKKSAQHQNLDCSTPFKQMNKYMKLLESTFSNGLTRFQQMSIILLSAQNVEQ